MDAFESIVSSLLWEAGYWTSVGYKVDLPKPVKVALGKPSLPRPEIDVLGYRAGDNRLLWVECKSYLDSRGVKFDSLTGPHAPGAHLYKTFTWPEYREAVTEALVRQLIEHSRIRPNPSVEYALVTGKIATDRDRRSLHRFFEEQGWLLFDEYWVKSRLENLAKKGYENEVAIIVAKLFSRVGG